MRVKKFPIAIFFGGVQLLLSAPAVLAQGPAIPNNPNAPPTFANLEVIIFAFINLAVNLSTFVAAAMIIYAGYMWMIAAGDPQRTKSAQGTFTWAAIGLVAMFLIRTSLSSIFNFLGI